MRLEYKYRVPSHLLDEMREAIAPFMKLDKHGRGYENKGYTIRSIYFDSFNLRYYHEKAAGIHTRRKIRVRAYNAFSPDARVFLEIKRKRNMAIAKARALLRYADLEPLLRTGHYQTYVNPYPDDPERNTAAQEEARRFLYHIYGYHLRPVNLVVYEREAYLGTGDPTLRITFDRDLRGKTHPGLGDMFDNDLTLVESLRDHFIMEVKFNTFFHGWLNPLLGQYNFVREAISKYKRVLDECKATDVDHQQGMLARPLHALNGLS
ncbi:MAG: polyphosphate polymerase domain-containing protein [Bacteroidota bacterium]